MECTENRKAQSVRLKFSPKFFWPDLTYGLDPANCGLILRDHMMGTRAESFPRRPRFS